jgi:signal transduction histidine kinase
VATWLKRVYPILALMLVVALLVSIVWMSHQLSRPDVALAIDHMEFTAISSDTLPGQSSQWQPVSLPDDWYHSDRLHKEGWYRHIFNLQVPPNRLWGIYLPTVQQNAAVYLNGDLLGDGGAFTDPVPRNWNRPLYFTIPNGLLKPGRNQISIRVQADPVHSGLLSSVFLGPDEFIATYYELRYFMRYTMAQFVLVTLVLTGIMMLMLWWHRRDDHIYAWYAFGVLEWAVHNIKLVVIDLPVDSHTWDMMIAVTMLWFPVIATSFIQRFIEQLDRRVERWSYRLAGFFSLVLLLMPNELSYTMAMHFTNPLSLAFGLYPVYRLLRYAWITPEVEIFMLMFSGMLLVVFGVHDLFIANHVLSRVNGYFMHYAAPPSLITFAYLLLKRFVSAMNETEWMNQSLEQQVREKHQELESNFSRMQQLERDRVLIEERERLMRDMHDGMGGHLVSTLALLETQGMDKPEVIHDALRAALDDLRLMIDSMEEVDGDVVTVLAMLRDRLEPRLRQAGVEIDWRMGDLPPLDNLGPQKSLQMLRIFQEALTNILKHANASRVVFETLFHHHEERPGIRIECRDDGCGFTQDPASNTSGRGLNNIRRRATQLQGHAGFDQALEGGLNVWLWVPLVDES